MLLALQVTTTWGQATSTQIDKPESLDESITYGKLENGLTYYIKNLQDSQKVNLSFYVKAGSKHQDPDQLNMAHFIEHMAFKSSLHFPDGIRNQLNLLNNIQVSQSDIGGTAGAYHTRYNFNLLPNNQKALETGLLWFYDIATGLRLKTEEINTERGVMVQEVVLRTADNIQDAINRHNLRVHVPCNENYSDFIKHHETFDPQRLRQFYMDWYRPDLMAITIVGKIDDVEALKKTIENQFSNIAPKKNPRKIPDCDAFFFNSPPQYTVVEKSRDSIRSYEKVEMEFLFRDRKTKELSSNFEGIKRINKIGLLIDILNNRLRETINSYNSFFDIWVEHTFKSSIAPSSFKVFVSTHNYSEKKALQELFGVLQQVQRHGILKTEFKEAKNKRISNLEIIDVNTPKYWQEEINNHLIYGEALPNEKQKHIKNWLSDYNENEFEEFIATINLEIPEDIGILAPANHPVLSWTGKDIRSIINEVAGKSISPYLLPETPIYLMTPSEVQKLKEHRYEDKGIGEVGAREIILKNGVKVVLKSFKPSLSLYQNKIMLHGFSKKGALNFSADDYFSAVNAPLFIRNSGMGQYDKFQLKRYLATKKLWLEGIKLYVNNQEAGIKLDTGLENIETALRMIYLYFSKPKIDSVAFIDWKNQAKLSYNNQNIDPKFLDLNNNIRKIIRDNSEASRGTERYAGIEKTDMVKGLAIYKQIFGNARDFTFTITGDFSVDSIIPFINKYLGNLPSFQSNETKASNIDAFTPRPIGPLLVRIRFPGTYNKVNYLYQTLYITDSKEHIHWKEKITAEVLGNILRHKVMELRYKKGFSLYVVSAFSVYNENKKQLELVGSFDCTPEEYPGLKKEFAKIVTGLKTDLITEELMQHALKRIKEKYDPVGMANSHRVIQENLYNHYRFDVPWVDKEEVLPYLRSLTPRSILKAAQKHLKDENYYEFVLMK